MVMFITCIKVTSTKEVMFLSVFVCDYSKTNKRICMKIFMWVELFVLYYNEQEMID